MNESTEFPTPPEHPEDAAAVPSHSPAPSQPDLLPWFCGLGFLVLAGGIYAAWQYPRTPGLAASHVLEQRVADLDARIGRLEQRPPAVNQADIGRLAARIDGLDAKGAEQTQVGGRLDGLSGRIEALAGRLQATLDAEKQQADQLSARVAALEKNAGSLDSVSDHLNRVTRIQEAGIALAAGRPVGDIPNAPPALARFAHEPAPTEVQLRLLFAQSERIAIEAKQPDDTSEPLIDRVWERAQNLVTVHRGEEVLVGNPASVTLSHAREALDAGDLKGAIASVETLKGQPKQAMAKWLAEAKALVDARTALASLAGQT
jgi:hypothetical protein